MTTRRRSGPRCGLVVAALALALVIPALAHAQILYGTITGTVTDPQKAAMPGVAVTATNVGTAFKTEAITDATGNYTFRNLTPGTYEVAGALQGFRELKQTGIAVTAGNIIRVDLTLQVGQLTETVNVVAESTLIKTEKADLTTEINSKQVTSLPLNYARNYQYLINLVPGATPTMMQNSEIDSPQRSLRFFVNGTMPNANTTRVDGAVSVNIWLPHHAGYVSTAETIDTVNVATNNFDADTGLAAGAAQSVVTKSGTNQLRGSAFWFYNGDKMNANSFYNNAFGIAKSSLNRQTMGGTLGGPVVKNKLFYFASWEYFRDRRGGTTNYVVPTDKMRMGDFSEVPAAFPKFKLFNPFSSATAAGRTTWDDFRVPAQYMSQVAQAINAMYPKVNSTRDLNSNGLYDDYLKQTPITVDKHNLDLKVTFQRSASHSIWGKVSYLNSNNYDVWYKGFDNSSHGNTKIYVVGGGHTWTLSPTLVLDGNVGMNRQDQAVTGPDYGTNYGLQLKVPGTNDPVDNRASGLPLFSAGYTIGDTAAWLPLWRKEITYTASSAITKVFPKHELRAGLDIVRMELNHRQAENGAGLRGSLTSSGNITGAPGYTALTWNSYAAFLMGLASSYGKDIQTEDMSGREWQTDFYIRDRWRPTEKLTVSAGLRFEYYPLMTRQNSGIERLDYSTWTVLMGGRGSTPKDVGLNLKKGYWVPRVGAAYRLNPDTVVRAGYGRTINPIPWSRPMRGSFPYDIAFSGAAETYYWNRTLEQGIPALAVPDFNTGAVTLPRGVGIRTPSVNDADRGVIQQWNAAFERRFPLDIAVEVAYVGTRTDGGYSDRNVNVGVPGGGNTAAQYYAQAGTANISEWGGILRSRYNGLQIAVNRPFRNGFMLKGAYTYSKARNFGTDEDGWTSLVWNYAGKFEDNYSWAGFDRRHVAQFGWVYELSFLKENTKTVGKLLGGWQLNGIASYYTGTPFSISGSNAALQCTNCGSVYINVNGNPSPIGTVGSMTDKWYDVSAFSQPSGATVAGFGSSKRNQFRRPPVWNLDLSLFKSFQLGRFRPEVRIEAANIFNHTNWGSPTTDFNQSNFMQFTPSSTSQANAITGDIPGARRLQIGLRLGF